MLREKAEQNLPVPKHDSFKFRVPHCYTKWLTQFVQVSIFMHQADEMQFYFFIWGWGLQVRTGSCYDHQGEKKKYFAKMVCFHGDGGTLYVAS